MQRIYCGETVFNETTISRSDPVIEIWGDSENSSVTPSFITNLVNCLNSVSKIQMSGIKKIESYALSKIQASYFDLILPDTLECIESHAFESCSAMNSIIIPSSVTEIGDHAFYNCVSLNHIYFKKDIKISYIPEYFCSGGGLNTVGIYDSATNTYTQDGVIEFPDSITEIRNNAFGAPEEEYSACSSMGNTLNIGDNVKSIGDYAFCGTAIDTINIGSGLNKGDNQEPEEFVEGGYDTEREITLPYTLYLSSKRQFRYKYFVVQEDSPAGTLYLMNVKEEDEEGSSKTSVYRTGDDDFKFCLDNSHLLVFKNGLLLPNTYYFLHSIINNPISDVGVAFNVSLKVGDRIDIFYVTNDLKHMEVEYYDMENKERYLKNGEIKIARNNSTEYRVMGDQLDQSQSVKTWRTNYIKLRSPLYAVSSKHSTFVFLNGRKVRMDELEDISDTIMSINTDYARSYDTRDNTMNAVRLEVMNHLDTQDIIEQLYINDGLSHVTNPSELANQFSVPPRSSEEDSDVYKNTHLISSINLTELEAYAKRTLLDDILNDLSDENLNKLFYNYYSGTGPMTRYDETKMNEPDFIKKEDVIQAIIDKCFNPLAETSEPDYVYSIDNNEASIIRYIGLKPNIILPTTLDDIKVTRVLPTAFKDNKIINRVAIPEGVEYLD